MFYSKRDIRFQLFEVLDAESLTKYPYFQDHNRESFDMVLEAADQIAEKMLYPLLTEMDRQEPQLVDGKIRVHEGMKAVVKQASSPPLEASAIPMTTHWQKPSMAFTKPK